MIKELEIKIPASLLNPFIEFKNLALPNFIKSVNPEISSMASFDQPHWITFADISDNKFRVLVKLHILDSTYFSEIEKLVAHRIENYDPKNWLLQHIRGNVLPHTDRDSGGSSMLIPIELSNCTVFAEDKMLAPTIGQPFVLNTKIVHGAHSSDSSDTLFLAYVGRDAKIA